MDDAGVTRHYPAYIGGNYVETDAITYGIDLAALLDPDSCQDLWTQLLSGSQDVIVHPYVLGSVTVATESLVKEAVEAAAAAAPRWARVPLEDRFRVGGEIRRRLLEQRHELTDLMLAEGCPRALVDWQLAGLANGYHEESLNWWAGQLDQRFNVDERGMRLVRRPDGVIGINPPRNAPAGNCLLAVAALLAGNSVIVRVPRSVPTSLSYLMADVVIPALEACQAPPGTLNVVCSGQSETMQRWLESPQVDSIFYFGTSAKGAAIEQQCLAARTKPILELSGNDGVLVWRDADLDGTVEALTECFLGSGQICMAPNYVLAHPAVADELLDRLTVMAGEQRAGHARTEGVTLSPVVKADQFDQWLDEAVAGGAEVICGGRRLGLDSSPVERGPFVEPTVLRIDGLGAAATHRVVREETFFPLLPVVVPKLDESPDLLAGMIAFLNSNRYGLRNSLWATDPDVIDRFLAEVTNGGNLKVNDSHLGCPRLLPSHGGTGLSGGVWDDANHVVMRTSWLQAITIGPEGGSPAEARSRVWG